MGLKENFKKVHLKLFLKYLGVIFLSIFITSSIAVLIFSFQIFSTLKDQNSAENLLKEDSLKRLHRQIQFLDLAISNPVMAVSSSILISPSSYQNLSLATSSGKEMVRIAENYSKGNSQRKNSLIDLAIPLENATPHAINFFRALGNLHLGGVLTPLDNKVQGMRAKSNEYLLVSESVKPLISILPALAGSKEPKKYLMAFQNSAEARGTGGILGAYAIVTLNKGEISFSDFGSNANLAQLHDIPIEMPNEYIRLYNDDPGIWQNSNLSAHFPYGARIWLALWERQFGERLDGVLTFDPIALSYLLRATGPVTANGEEINSENVVRITLSDLYQKYKTNNDARKKFLINIIQAVSKPIEENKTSLIGLLKNLVIPLNEHRLLIYSDDPISQKVIEKSSLSGSIEEKSDNQFRLIIQNTSGNKMDYYLVRKFQIESIQCKPVRKTKITFTLGNKIGRSEKLPSYVIGRLDLNLPNGLNNSYGTRAIVLFPKETSILETKDLQTGKRFGFLVRERGRIGIGVQLDLAAGESETYSIMIKGGVGDLTNYTQPLVIPQQTEIIDHCKSS